MAAEWLLPDSLEDLVHLSATNLTEAQMGRMCHNLAQYAVVIPQHSRGLHPRDTREG